MTSLLLNPTHMIPLILVVMSPSVQSRYLRHLEGEDSSDNNTSTENDDLSLTSKIIVYSVISLFGIMCVSYLLHLVAKHCLGFVDDLDEESRDGSVEVSTQHRRQILEVLFETNKFQKVSPTSPQKHKYSNSSGLSTVKEDNSKIINVETIDTGSDTNSENDECVDDDQIISTKSVSAPDTPNTAKTEDSTSDTANEDDKLSPPSHLQVPELISESNEPVENKLQLGEDFPAVKKKGDELYSGISQTDDTNEMTCSICLDDYDHDDVVVQSKHCSHYFHKECILDWLIKSDQCPCCRVDMMSIDEVHEAASKVVGKDNVKIVGTKIQLTPPNSPQRISIRPTPLPPRSSSIPFYYPE